MILCCEGIFLLLGIFLLSFRELRIGGRLLEGRRLVVVGLLFLIQAPLAIWLGGHVLGDVQPGALDGAPAREGLTRFWANLAELGLLGGVILIASIIWYTSPLNLNEEGTES